MLFRASVLLALFSTSALAAYDSIPASMFNDDPAQAARQSAPFFFFGRSLNRNPCYPESAVTNEGGPNPGTEVDGGPSPGKGCASPGDYQGRYTHGNAFPTYFNVKYCEGDDSYRINYNLYFSHDGMGLIGHRHDWEWVAAIWKKCPNSQDQYCRDRLVMSFHKTDNVRNWGDIQNTVNGPDEVQHLGDKNKHHPLVYVGAFKHAMFDTRKTSVNVLGADNDEFRSNDWWYFSQDYLVDGNVIDRSWDFGEAKSIPPSVSDGICSK